jgi:hypothetical protein
MCETIDAMQARSKRRKLADLFLLLAIVVGMALILLEPPFVCPDENALSFALKVRKNPLEAKNDPAVFDFAEGMADAIQRFNDVLGTEIDG